MNIGESLSIATESMAANKMRSILTMLGVIIGVGTVIITMGIGEGTRRSLMAMIQQRGTNVLTVFSGQMRSSSGGRVGFGGSVLTLDDIEALRTECPSLATVVPEARTDQTVKYGSENSRVNIMGTSPDYPEVRNYAVEEGRFFTDAEVRGITAVGIIGPTTATTLFGEESPLEKTVRIKGKEFRIIGVFKAKGAAGGFGGDPDDIIVIPYTTALRRLMGSLKFRNIAVQAASMDVMGEAQQEITAALLKSHKLASEAEADFTVRNQADEIDMAQQNSAQLTQLLAGIAIVSLLVGGIGIMNIMLVSVTERTREIGIRKAIGGKRADIFGQFLIESLALSLLGGGLGIALGYGGAWLYQSLTGTVTVVPIAAVIVAFVASAIVGVVSGAYPAWRASSLPPIEALRYE